MRLSTTINETGVTVCMVAETVGEQRILDLMLDQTPADSFRYEEARQVRVQAEFQGHYSNHCVSRVSVTIPYPTPSTPAEE